MNKRLTIFLGVILVLIISFVVIAFFNKHEGELIITDEIDNNEAILYYRLDNSNIYLHGINNIYFKYNNLEKKLSDWFLEDDKFLDKFLDTLEYVTVTYDGGTILYRDGGTKVFQDGNINVFKCNTLDGNKDIHIGKDLVYDGDVCRIKSEEVIKENLGDVVNITTLYPKSGNCNDNLEEFYVDGIYHYYKSPCSMIVVLYQNGIYEEVASALRYGTISISDLDKYNIDYYNGALTQEVK